jgi:hypothetical protein
MWRALVAPTITILALQIVTYGWLNSLRRQPEYGGE